MEDADSSAKSTNNVSSKHMARHAVDVSWPTTLELYADQWGETDMVIGTPL